MRSIVQERQQSIRRTGLWLPRARPPKDRHTDRRSTPPQGTGQTQDLRDEAVVPASSNPDRRRWVQVNSLQGDPARQAEPALGGRSSLHIL